MEKTIADVCPNQNNYSMSNRMFISTKKACVIKRFKDQVNLSEPLSDDSGLACTIQ
jgi:hypothetical protein